MSIIEQAARRLEELRRAGVEVPWAAAGLSEAELRTLVPGTDDRRRGALHPVAFDAQTPGSAHLTDTATSRSRPSVANEGIRRSKSVEINFEHLAQAGYLVPGHSQSALADEFRVIKRPLIKNAQRDSATPVHRANLIQVTSALPGEGKTFCAINLALSIAMEVDKTVLLVDADVVRPSVGRCLRLGEEHRGLMDLLSDEPVDLCDVMLRTNIAKLTLLPSGKAGGNSTELLASDRMNQLLDELATKYPDRIVIFDGPPLLPTTESRVLAARMGQVVMVVESSKTTEQTVAQAFATLEACPVVMAVLNKCRTPASTYRFGYYEG